MLDGFNRSRFLLRTAVLFCASIFLAVAVNATRPDPLDWIASEEYEIFEECPEGEESSTPVTLQEVTANPDYFFIVDSRDSSDFERGHVEGAMSVPYDPLFPVMEDVIDELLVSAGDRTVVVIGDTLIAKLLADDLISQGVPIVHYLEEGEDWRVLLPAVATEDGPNE